MSYQKSTRSLKQEVLTICGELTDGTSEFDAQAVAYLNKLNQGLIAGNNLFDISCMEPWIWAQSKRNIVLQLLPAVTGTVSLTNGSAAITLQAAPSANIQDRVLFLDGIYDTYVIGNHEGVSTSASLDSAFTGTTAVYNYTAIKTDYAVNDEIIVITNQNNQISFTEGSGNLTATLTRGSYTPTTYCAEVKTQLEAAGAETYTVTFDELTRKFTIAHGGATLSLLFGSGAGVIASRSAANDLGFNDNDYTGAVTYTAPYVLSGIVRFSKPISIQRGNSADNPKEANKIFMIDDNTFLRDYPINQSNINFPDKFCIIMQDPDGQTTIRFNASVLETTRIDVPFIPIPKDLIDNVYSFPLVPGSFSDFLVYGAAHFIQMDKSDSKATDSLQKAQALLKALIAFNRQGSQVAGNNVGRVIARPNQKSPRSFRGRAY